MTTRYLAPQRTSHFFNDLVGRLATVGVSILGTRLLAVLRAYLKRWKFEVGVFFDGIDHTATDDQLLAIAPGYPVFRL